MRRRVLSTLGLVVVLAAAGCGGGGGSPGDETKLPSVVEGAKQPQPRDFPKPEGRTLKQLAETVPDGPHAALAASVFLPGTQRLAFGLIDNSRKFVYASTAVYLAPTIDAPARGPYLAPLDSIVPSAAYRSRTTAADAAAIKAIYSADIPLRTTGPMAALVLSKRGQQLQRSLVGFKVTGGSPIPNVGDRPPRIATPTEESASGNLAAIDTRVPPDTMHEVSFKDVIGKKPVALLFATPLLCQSRVCGPVTDIAEQLKARYGSRMAFIHQEVYNDNQVNKGLRPQLAAFHLQTEPWFFTFDRSGRVAARLEGSFGLHAMAQAIDAAL
ncbi:MAG: hypothetical protein QOD71_1771 [Thermoleophilaceae bacterium]|nr:hypothetical protein [Thermoleophilaceae bacterium]